MHTHITNPETLPSSLVLVVFINAGDGVEEREPSFTVGGNVN